jgi:tRNA threonylcarbamoyladenosine biosynthesis protein TsaB
MAELLAIDTSTDVGSVAVGHDGRILAEVTLGSGPRHSSALLPAIRFALDHARVQTAQLSGIVVGGGPGSFTGVRIAAATAKGLAYAAQLPFYAFSTLLALAATAAAGDRPVCAMIDARRGEVYAACYRFGEKGPPEVLVPPAARPLALVLENVAALDPVFAGDGALRYRSQLGGATVAPAHLCAPRAAALLWLAHRTPETGRVPEPARWQPDYLRPSGAERGTRA